MELIMTGRHLWIGTSWKMNKTRAEARAFATALSTAPITNDTRIQPFVIPPFTSISEAATLLASTRVRVGAQNMHWADAGAWTGEISPLMIKDAGATLVELGHSERRTHFGETNETVSMKVAAALKHGLTPLICIGDTREEFDAKRTAEVLARQVAAALSKIAPEHRTETILFAYEPVWSIGEGGTPAEPGFVNEQHILIKALTERVIGRPLPVLYGGSVNPGNARELASQTNVDGLFIGRSAWAVEGYVGILEMVAELLRPTVPTCP
jgi:L-erythrulose 1-phosphate isomerase